MTDTMHENIGWGLVGRSEVSRLVLTFFRLIKNFLKSLYSLYELVYICMEGRKFAATLCPIISRYATQLR